MFGSIGTQELLLILGIALIVFGPRKLPEIGKSMGKMMAEFRKASSDFQRTIEEEVEAEKRTAALPPPPVVETPAVTEPAAPAEPVAIAAADTVAQSSTPYSETTPELGPEGTTRS
jgi:TatA/E family protein of Tat protein translocase